MEKHRVVEQRIDVSVHQIGQRFVPFAVKRREQEDQDADDQAARDPTAVHAFDPGEQLPDFRVDLCEIVRHQPAYQAQDDVVRQVFQFERVQDIEVENRIETVQEKHQRRGGHGRNQQRDDRCDGDVEHQYLQHEDDSGDRRLEYGRQGRRRAATQQQRDVLVIESHEAGDIRSDGRSGQYDRRLRADRTAETDRRRTRDDRRIAVVRLDARPFFAHPVQYAGHSFADVVAHDVLDEQCGDDDSDDRIEQVENAGRVDVEPAGQHEAEKHQRPFEYERSEPRRQTDHDREQNHQLFIGQPLGSDDQVAVQQRYFVSQLRHGRRRV